MSGTIDVNTILGPKLPEQPNMLSQLTGWQELTNKQLSADQTRASTANTLQNTANAQLQNQRDQQSFSLAQQNAVAQGLAPLLRKDTVDASDITSTLKYLRSNNVIDDQRLQNALAALPPGNDPAANKQFLGRLLIGTFAGPEAAKYLIPQPGTINDGQSVQGITQDPTTGAITTAGNGVPVWPSRSDLATGVEVTTGDGRKFRVPAGSLVPTTLGGPAAAQTQGGGAGPAPSQTPLQPGKPAPAGYQPPSPNNPPRLPSAATGAPSAAPSTGPLNVANLPGAVQTGLGPEQDTNLKSSATAYADARDNADRFQQQMAPLYQASELLKSAQTGPVTDRVNALKSFVVAQTPQMLQRVGFLQSTFDGLKSDNEKYDYLGKIFAQIVMSSPSATRSEANLAMALSGNGNTHLATGANIDVIKAGIALRRYDQAAFKEYEAEGRPGQWSDFLSDYQTRYDPRAFALDQMNDTQKKALLTSMKDDPKARGAFKRSLDLASRHPELMRTQPMSVNGGAP